MSVDNTSINVPIELLNDPEFVDMYAYNQAALSGIVGLDGLGDLEGLKSLRRKLKKQFKKQVRFYKKTGRKLVRLKKNILTAGIYGKKKAVSRYKKKIRGLIIAYAKETDPAKKKIIMKEIQRLRKKKKKTQKSVKKFTKIVAIGVAIVGVWFFGPAVFAALKAAGVTVIGSAKTLFSAASVGKGALTAAKNKMKKKMMNAGLSDGESDKAIDDLMRKMVTDPALKKLAGEDSTTTVSLPGENAMDYQNIVGTASGKAESILKSDIKTNGGGINKLIIPGVIIAAVAMMS